MADEPAPQSVTQGATKVATGIVAAFGAAPLALALLLVNMTFLGFAAYILGEVSENARERNKTQNELIAVLVKEIRDCHAPAPTRTRQPTTATPIDEKG
jgi:hypothetical protein